MACKANVSAFRRIFQGIVKQNDDQLMDAFTVAHPLNRDLRFDAHRFLLVRNDLAVLFANVADQFIQPKRFFLHFQLIRV